MTHVLCGWCAMRSEVAARRALIRQGGWLAVLASAGVLGWTSTRANAATNHNTDLAFTATNLEDTLRGLGAIHLDASDPSGIELTVPEVNENGALVPVSVSSNRRGTQEILLIVEHNPQPLVVQFKFPAGTEPFVATRVRMAASGRVYAVVKAEDRLYATFKEAKVTLSGCA
jgi:sulfur-oxidizing protein SoxY